MASVEQFRVYLMCALLINSGNVLATSDIYQTSPTPVGNVTSHGGEMEQLSTDSSTSLLDPSLVLPVFRGETGNLETTLESNIDSFLLSDPLKDDIFSEEEGKSSTLANFLTPVNPFWTELPLNESSINPWLPSYDLPEEELVKEPFYETSQHAIVNTDKLAHRGQSTLEWSISIVSPSLGEEGTSSAFPSSVSPPGEMQPPQSTLESQFPGLVFSVEAPSTTRPMLVVIPTAVGQESLETVGPQKKSTQYENLDNPNAALELPEHSVTYDMEKDTKIAPLDVVKHTSSTEKTMDGMYRLPVLTSTSTSTPLEIGVQDIIPSTPEETGDGTPSTAASTGSSCDPEKAEDCSPFTTESTTEITTDASPYFLPSPPLFITLHSDWNSAIADWGLAWEIHIYGTGALFGGVACISLLSLLCLPFRCPFGCRFFVVLDLLLISAGGSRAFSMFYDAYSHQERLPAFTALLLYDVTFPCLTSSLGVVFLLLSMRSRVQLSNSRYQHPCALATIVFLHFFISMGAIIAVNLLHQFPFLLFISRGVFVGWAAVLSLAFFIFYCLVKPDNMQLYDLKCSMPSAEYPRRCPFADAEDWNRAAQTGLFSAIFGLFNAGLQLYAMLYALGYGGSLVFTPWLWWAMQLGIRLCEVGMCVPLALVSMYPVFCSRELPRFQCWTKFFCLSPGHVNMKAPILPNNCAWAESQHEKLMICETIARSDSEFLPLYALVQKRFSSGEDLDLMYHSNKSMDFGVSDLNLKNSYGSKDSSFISVQLDSDSTVDFRPPSPINLRRSIDEALFGEALILKSLFHGPALSSTLSLNIKSAALPESHLFKEKASDRGLYRTSSCMEIETVLPAVVTGAHASRQDTTLSSPGLWRGGGGSQSSSLYKLSLDGSSLVLCSSTEKMGHTSSFSFDTKAYKNLSQANLSRSSQAQRQYRTLAPPSQDSLDILGHQSMDLQEQLMDVCRQIDTFSVNSETIDL
ncbi:hypothetical protein NDU88_002987 [Pleurodeles waltl]|uniref:Proline-rich transmembrane protein 3/4 domain-containing protein n=1 Tax=Pleurodeles waltl TaxID=8319 RepID=A0AAV7SDJ9_PLEWA|nr:hypothetical protein NDU88_002987 [Pleurodeles waltl]